MIFIDRWVIYHLALFWAYFVKGYNRCRFAKLKNPADLCAPLTSYNTHFAKYEPPLVGQLYIMSGILAFLGYFEVGARLYEVSIHSTLQYIVVLILVGKSYKKVLTHI